MNKYTIQIKLLSQLLASSGEGATLIDADCTYDDAGLPFIPSRRIKGTLKESALEVLEILNCEEKRGEKLMEFLFGETGLVEGQLSFGNAYILDYENTYKILKAEAKEKKGFANPDFVKHYFTEEIQQTALDNEGIADEHTLRNYRVIKSGNAFEAVLTVEHGLSEAHLGLLQLAFLNMRHIGSRRNRGLGHVQLSLNEEVLNIDSAINAVLNDNSSPSETDFTLYVKPKEEVAGNYKMPYTITLKSPLVVAEARGDKNTVNTADHLPGTLVRGIFASKLSKKSRKNNLHENSYFYDTILSGKVSFGQATINGANVLPLNLHQAKRANKKDGALNVFSNPKNPTKPVSGRGIVTEDGQITTAKTTSTFFFHNSRGSHRIAGTNQDDGIFYYEGLNSGQTLEGHLYGPKHLLDCLKEHLKTTFDAQAGRSRTAQYGQISIELMEPVGIDEVAGANSGDDIYLLALSPIIVLNKDGMAEPTKANLANIIGLEPKFIEEVATKHIYVEYYNSQWQSRSTRMAAFDAGSVFKCKATETLVLQTAIGEGVNLGFGRIEIKDLGKEKFTFKQEDKKSHPQTVNADGLCGKIEEAYNKREAEINEKKKAIKEATAFGTKKHLRNHLVSRLLGMIETDPNSFVKNLGLMKEKPAGVALRKARIYDTLLDDFNGTNAVKKEIYWPTYFKTLRKLK